MPARTGVALYFHIRPRPKARVMKNASAALTAVFFIVRGHAAARQPQQEPLAFAQDHPLVQG